MMQIRNAEKADAPRILEIIESAKASLRAMGVDQWQNGYPNLQSVQQDIASSICRVLEDSGVLLASAGIYVGREPTYDEIDGKWLTENVRYGVIHRIATAPESRGRGAASALIGFCAELCRAEGIASMRCDTHPQNKPMRRTLEKNGYLPCGMITLQDGSKRIAYEKIL